MNNRYFEAVCDDCGVEECCAEAGGWVGEEDVHHKRDASGLHPFHVHVVRVLYRGSEEGCTGGDEAISLIGLI